MSLIQNPILRGFNADPSIIRVEDTYYIANSTFEWFPFGVLHGSQEL
ncbi:family 43 glycosylhydrolase, partial [Klebsiella pneumoniae]